MYVLDLSSVFEGRSNESLSAPAGQTSKGDAEDEGGNCPSPLANITQFPACTWESDMSKLLAAGSGDVTFILNAPRGIVDYKSSRVVDSDKRRFPAWSAKSGGENQPHKLARLETTERVFSAHRAILGVRSVFFNALFEGTLKSNDALFQFDGPKDILELVIHYIYCGLDSELQEALQQIEPRRILLLLLVANQYVIEGLQLRCEWALSKHVTTDNVLDLLDSISSINAPLLRAFCMHFAITHQVAVNETNVFDFLLLTEMRKLQDIWN